MLKLKLRTLTASTLLAVVFWGGSGIANGADITQELDISLESTVIATQGAATVSQADFDAYMSRIADEDRVGFLSSRDRIGQALENLMLPRLLANQAHESGLIDDPSLQAKLYQTATVLIAEEYIANYFAERELDDYSQLAREMFMTQPDRFRAPKRFDFTHVLVSVGQERGELDAMERISSIYAQLSEGADISALAAEYSDDPAMEDNAGSYVEIDPEILDPAVAQALALMQPDQISEPVRSEYGWHVIRLDQIRDRRQLEWEEAEELALRLARERHLNQVRETLILELRSDPMEVDPDAVQEILTRYDVPWDFGGGDAR